MIYGSVCSGIEAASVAWKPLGWEPAFFAEIEKFPSAVLAERHPGAPNWGDIKRFKEWPDARIDLLVGGTPCQSFSVAGLRKGLDDPRGNLMLTYLAIARRYRPRWLVWENVPGVLSSSEGRDFGALLGGLAELGYGFAYRILDAQHFGVPQRRRRVFVVGYLGDWRRAAAVLFERQSLSWDSPPCREAGERVADSLTVGANHCSGTRSDFVEHAGDPRGQDCVIPIALPLLAKSNNSFDHTLETYVAHALRADGFDASEDGTGRGPPIIAFDERSVTSPGNLSAPATGRECHTLHGEAPSIAFQYKASAASQSPSCDEIAPTLDQSKGSGISAFTPGMSVRCLTPRECERLQGFPDDYTLIDYRGRPAKDGPRYKALGNSMAVPCMEWIGRRIQMVEDLLAPQAARADKTH